MILIPHPAILTPSALQNSLLTAAAVLLGMASAKYSPQPVADSDSGESDYDSERCVENLQNRMPHWNCCVWFCIIVATAMIISEVLAWLRQPVCGSANFSWNEVIPPNTVNQIERNNLATMLQEYDVLGDLDQTGSEETLDLLRCIVFLSCELFLPKALDSMRPSVYPSRLVFSHSSFFQSKAKLVSWRKPYLVPLPSLDLLLTPVSQGLWTKLWHFDVYENATALSSSGTDQQAKIFRGPWETFR